MYLYSLLLVILSSMVQEEDTDTARSPSIHPAGYDTTPLTKQDKKRVLNADPNGGHCLITNAISPKSYCYCIPRHFMRKKDIVRVYIFPTLKCLSYLLHCIIYIQLRVDSLEWAWNMKRYTLNLNTIQNILLGKYYQYQTALISHTSQPYEFSIVTKDLHIFFESYQWLLMPVDNPDDNHILNTFFETLITVGPDNFCFREKFPEFLVCLLLSISIILTL